MAKYEITLNYRYIDVLIRCENLKHQDNGAIDVLRKAVNDPDCIVVYCAHYFPLIILITFFIFFLVPLMASETVVSLASSCCREAIFSGSSRGNTLCPRRAAHLVYEVRLQVLEVSSLEEVHQLLAVLGLSRRGRPPLLLQALEGELLVVGLKEK